MSYQDRWISNRTSEILSDPTMLGRAVASYASLFPTKAGQVFKNAASGTVGDMLILDDWLQKAAEIAADDDWHSEGRIAA